MLNLMLASATALSLFTTIAEADDLQRWLRVNNNTKTDLCSVRISHIQADWGQNLIKKNSCIPAGDWGMFDPGWQQGYCLMDMKFIFKDKSEISSWRFNICKEAEFNLTE